MTRWLLLGLLGVGGCAPSLIQPARTVTFPNGAALITDQGGVMRKHGPSEIIIPRRTALPLCHDFACHGHPYHLDAHCQCANGTVFRLKVETSQ